MKVIFLFWLCLLPVRIYALQDSTANPQEEKRPLKLLHAEPLYIDLIRDLGAHKGEREWNVGMGMTDKTNFDSYEFLVEYEWAVIDRLGLEIELPVTIYTNGPANRMNSLSDLTKPSNRVESLKMAAQYTFLVSEHLRTSMAIGGITEIEFTDLNTIGREQVFQGILYNPFLIAAKNWGSSFHTLLYTGPRITTHFDSDKVDFAYEINSNFHYMIPGTRNFVGVEFNKIVRDGKFDMVIRPQMRLTISDGLLVGIVPSIPVARDNERLGAFMRLIYEPRHHKH